MTAIRNAFPGCSIISMYYIPYVSIIINVGFEYKTNKLPIKYTFKHIEDRDFKKETFQLNSMQSCFTFTHTLCVIRNLNCRAIPHTTLSKFLLENRKRFESLTSANEALMLQNMNK